MKRGHKAAKAFLKACTVLLIGLWVTWVCLAQSDILSGHYGRGTMSGHRVFHTPLYVFMTERVISFVRHEPM